MVKVAKITWYHLKSTIWTVAYGGITPPSLVIVVTTNKYMENKNDLLVAVLHHDHRSSS